LAKSSKRGEVVQLSAAAFLRSTLGLCVVIGLGVQLCGLVRPVQAQGAVSKIPPSAMQTGSAEKRTARALDAAKQNPLALRAFLISFPKGADLHNHLDGAVYAESWIRAAAEDKMCVQVSTLSLLRSQPGAIDAAGQPVCADGQVLAQRAYEEQSLYDELIDAFSMRGFVPSAGVTAHDHFFGTFAKFGAEDPRHTGEWLDEVATRAAAQNEQYLELMVTPPFPKAVEAAKQLGWRSDSDFGAFEIICKAMELKTMWPPRGP
jgi:adenosine deaminase